MEGPVGVGLGWRAALAADLLRSRDAADFVEVVAETCLVQPAARREARAIAEIWPVIPHGVKLSLGSAEGIELARARALGALARELRAPVISEHVAFVRSGSREIGHLTALPKTRTALEAVRRNVARARRCLPDVPLLLENVAWTFQWPESEMEEGDFYCEVARLTGCPLLLDVGNLYANAVNSGKNPLEAVRRFPLERVAMVHIAGGVAEDGFFFDDHAHSISDPVFELLEVVLATTGEVPVLLERDAEFPPFQELRSEVERCRGLLRGAPSRSAVVPIEPASAPSSDPDSALRFERAQSEVARLLTDVEPPDAAARARFGCAALTRSRAVLQRKRVDEALPLLPLLSRHRPSIDALAFRVVEESRRLPRLAAISDALEIAGRARAHHALARDAERDALALETRFARDSTTGLVEPRRSPYVAVRQLADGGRVIALKGFGAHARARFFERRLTRQ